MYLSTSEELKKVELKCKTVEKVMKMAYDEAHNFSSSSAVTTHITQVLAGLEKVMKEI